MGTWNQSPPCLDSWVNHKQTCGEEAFWSPVRDGASPQLAKNAIPPSLETRAEDMQYLRAPKWGPVEVALSGDSPLAPDLIDVNSPLPSHRWG